MPSVISKLFRAATSRQTLFQNQFARRYKKPNQKVIGVTGSHEYRRGIWIMRGGIFFTTFALCYFMVPFYRVFCEATGLLGDADQKNYADSKKKAQTGKQQSLLGVLL